LPQRADRKARLDEDEYDDFFSGEIKKFEERKDQDK